MLATLHWTLPVSDLPAASAALAADIIGPVPNAVARPADDQEISIANALFGQRGYAYKQPFLELLAKQYKAPLQSVDFVNQPKQAFDQINKWASDNTHDRIQNAVPESAISPTTRLVLVDAIYFKAAWDEAFKKSATEDQPFYPDGKDPINLPLMQQKHSFRYMENDSLQAVELPYKGGFSMLILLPRKRDGLAELEKSFTSDALTGWLKQLGPQVVQLSLPKFRIEGEFDLKDTLGKMGMTDAFDPNTADFSGITTPDRLSIDHVIHKTFIAVDEEGTEAAAVTSVTMGVMAMRPGALPEPVIFRADHPFLFVLRHSNTGAILFMGRVVEPK
jgi:serpin B